MLLLFTMPNCERCKRVKEKLDYEDYEYRLINVLDSDENLELAKKYNIRNAGTVIDDKTGQEYTLPI
jgi:glutaredoxin